MQKHAKLTSKGQITIPRDVRKALGVRAGDRVVFEQADDGLRVKPLRKVSPFEKYRGIGNPGIGRGKKSISKWLRALRGE